jgi:hypothetical protein
MRIKVTKLISDWKLKPKEVSSTVSRGSLKKSKGHMKAVQIELLLN